MSTNTTDQTTATANDVRKWGIANGFKVGLTLGRLSFDLIEAYNAHNDVAYPMPERKEPAARTSKPTIITVKTVRAVVGKDGKTRNVPFQKKVTASDVRAYGISVGLAKAGRGKLSHAAREAYARHLVNA